jgi:DNA polymerase I
MSINALANSQNMDREKPVFILIDGHSLAFRSYYAFLYSRQGALRTSTGIPTSICFGFLNSLLQVIELEKPEYLAIAFDLPEPTFRHQADSNYKGNRQETPDDFIPDLINLQQLLIALNFTVTAVSGYEADDVIGTLARQAADTGYRVKILSGDRDLFQLVDDRGNIEILYPDSKSIKSNQSYAYFNRESVIEKLQITPEQIVDFKALCGDKSDNIPGVKGIGEKTAVKLLAEYQTLENIYQNIEQIKGAVQNKLITDRDNALLSQFLAKIALDTPVNIELESCQIKEFESSEVEKILDKLELKKIRDRIERILVKKTQKAEKISKKIPQKTVIEAEGQLSLFETAKSNITTPVTEINRAKEAIQAENLHPKIITNNLQPLVIDTTEKLAELITILKQQTDRNHPVAWDTETTSLEPHNAFLVGIGCCWGEQSDRVAYIPLKHTEGRQLDNSQVLAALKEILESDRYPKAFQNTKFDRLVFQYQGIKLTGVIFDTMLASYILNPDNSHNLTELSQRYQIEMIALSYKDLGISKGKTIADLDITTVAKYCGLDCYATYCLVPRIQADLDRVSELNKLLKEVEQPLEIVLSAMESTGITLDVAYLNQLAQKLATDLAIIERAIYQEAEVEFKLNSPKQLANILFEKLGLDRRKSRKTKTGYSTNQAVLEKLKDDHVIIDRILEYRTLSKLKSTYVDALPTLIRPETQRVHTDFNQAITTTGRLSSSNPNLQNIPIRTEFSRQIRKAFIPQKDWLLVAADYSQIELRILAHLSQEPILVDAYRNSLDVHSVTAQLLFEKEDITPEERRLGKIINFGVIYGMGAGRFSRESGFTINIGREFIDKYRQRYAKVFDYLESVKKLAVTQGFVTTILGRRRYFNFASRNLQKLQGENPDSINLAEINYDYQDAQLLRAAANSPIQGSSADIIKIAMIKLHQILQQYQAKLLLQVHDELVFEIPSTELPELKTQIKAIMENSVNLSVPLLVDLHAGQNWMEAK